MNTCISCGTSFTGYGTTLECGFCRQIGSQRRMQQQAEDSQRQQTEELRREMKQNEQRLRQEAAEAEYRFEQQTQRLIAEQQKTQQLLQEQRITPQMAYDNGYELFRNKNDTIELNLDNMTYKFTFSTDTYLTEVLQSEFKRGYLARLNDGLLKLDFDIARNCYLAGTKGWQGFSLSSIKVDSCPVTAVWLCDTVSEVDKHGYISYKVRDESQLNRNFLSEYKRGLAEFEATQNTVELKNQRALERKKIEDENLAKQLANEERIRSEREWLRQQREKKALKKNAIKIGVLAFILGMVGLIAFNVQWDQFVFAINGIQGADIPVFIALICCGLLVVMNIDNFGKYLLLSAIVFIPMWLFFQTLYFAIF